MNDPEQQRQAFGRRVRNLRKARGLKQEVLAEALGYRSRVSISHLETGREDLPLTKVFALATVLEVSPVELFRPDSGASAGEAVLPPPLQPLAAIWQALGERERQVLRRCAEILASGEADIARELQGLIRLMAETVETRRIRRGGTGAPPAEDPPAG